MTDVRFISFEVVFQTKYCKDLSLLATLVVLLNESHSNNILSPNIKGVMSWSMVDALSELWSPFLRGGDSAFVAAIVSGLFPQSEYQSLK